MFFESVRRDILYSLRTMVRNPAFASTAMLILGLGIGGNAAMFTVIRAVLLRPLDYREPDRLVYFSVENPRRPQQNPSFSLVQFAGMKAAAKTFSLMGAYGRPENFALSSGGEPEELKGARVSANFLEVLGVPPAMGRSFLSEEDKPGGTPVAMISTGLWKRRFSGDPGVVGKEVTLESTAYTVIGVLPGGFEFPYADVDVWVTRPSEWSMLPPRYWGVPTLTGFGRLKAGASVEQADKVEPDIGGMGPLRLFQEDELFGKRGAAAPAEDQADNVLHENRPRSRLFHSALPCIAPASPSGKRKGCKPVIAWA